MTADRLLAYTTSWRTNTVNQFMTAPALGRVTLSRCNPAKFFQTREGLWVSEECLSAVAEEAPLTEPREVAFEHSDLLGFALDDQMVTEEHAFDEALVWYLAERLITGEERLVKGGSANVFYTPSGLLRICWDKGVNLSDPARWDVLIWRRRGHRWPAGTRVFRFAHEKAA